MVRSEANCSPVRSDQNREGSVLIWQVNPHKLTAHVWSGNQRLVDTPGKRRKVRIVATDHDPGMVRIAAMQPDKMSAVQRDQDSPFSDGKRQNVGVGN